jgi:hypothetical protein
MDKWQDWTNFALGLWVIVSPWTIEHVMAGPITPRGVTEAAMWNHYIIGLAVVILAVVAICAWTTWLEWTNLILGAWLSVSPWFLGFSMYHSLMWNSVFTGGLIVLFALWSVAQQQPPQLPKQL